MLDNEDCITLSVKQGINKHPFTLIADRRNTNWHNDGVVGRWLPSLHTERQCGCCFICGVLIWDQHWFGFSVAVVMETGWMSSFAGVTSVPVKAVFLHFGPSNYSRVSSLSHIFVFDPDISLWPQGRQHFTSWERGHGMPVLKIFFLAPCLYWIEQRRRALK